MKWGKDKEEGRKTRCLGALGSGVVGVKGRR